MGTKPVTGRGYNVHRLNMREIYPVYSDRHPAHLSTPPSDALCVLWLDSEGAGSESRFAFLNYSRALALYTELGRILNGERRGSVERARRMLAAEGYEGGVSGA